MDKRDIREKKTTQPTPSPLPKETGPPDNFTAELLVAAIGELNIIRKNSITYPLGHAQVTLSVERGLKMLRQLGEILPELTLEVKKDGLVVDNVDLEPNNSVIREYANALHRSNIAVISLTQGIARNELERFQRIITGDPKKIMEAGGIEKAVTEAGLPHIEIQAIDYRNLRLTEEDEIVKEKDPRTHKPGAGLWHKFVTNLVSGKLKKSQRDALLTGSIRIRPEKMAHLLNQRKLDANLAVEQYADCLGDYARKPTENETSSEQQNEIIENFNKIIKHLKPRLRKQFLSAAFSSISDQNSPEAMAAILRSLSDDMIIEMLRQANEEDREISPALISLVQKMANARRSNPGSAESRGATQEETDSALDISLEQMKDLFKRENYESFVDTEYDDTLKRLTGGLASQSSSIEDFDLDRHMNTLEDDQLNSNVSRVLFSVIDEDIDTEAYRVFSQQLSSTVPALLNRGEFRLLKSLFRTFSKHSREKKSAGVRMLAKEALKAFYTSEFSINATAAYEKWVDEKSREVSNFMLTVGQGCISRLVNLYRRDDYSGDREMLVSLFSAFGAPAFDEIYAQLKDPRDNVVLKMVNLIGSIGNPSALAHLNPLLIHHALEVRLAVLDKLIKLKDPSSAELLRAAFQSKEPEMAAQAVFLSGKYRVTDVTRDLIRMIEKLSLRKADLSLNETIIKALGNISDPAAVPALEKISRRKWTLFPKRLARMKAILHESLAGYPQENVKDMLRQGRKSD